MDSRKFYFVFVSLLVLGLGMPRDIRAAIFCVDTAVDEEVVNAADCTHLCGTEPLCSLREAIEASNTTAGIDTISFNIPGDGPHEIAPTTNLPPLTRAVNIYGLTQPGSGPGQPAVIVRGGAGATLGLEFRADNIQLSGIRILNFSDSGLKLINSHDSYIGPDNLISDCGEGIRIEGGSGNSVIGNLIGTSLDGLTGLGNNTGITLTATTSHNLIGGPNPEDRNVISGSLGSAGEGTGIRIDVFSHHNVIENNFIGTDKTGLDPLANQGAGIVLTHGAHDNAIGPGNVISANGGEGIQIIADTALANDSVSGNQIFGNLIGVGADQVTELGNGSHGILIQSGADAAVYNAPNNHIGGLTDITFDGACTGQCNLIAYNEGAGIKVAEADENLILSNLIFGNGDKGIDLSGGTGNGGQASIQLNDYDFDFDTDIFNVSGILVGAAATTYQLQVFANDACDSSGAGEGQRLIGSQTVTTDGVGTALLSTDVNIPTGTVLTVTTTNTVTKNTSEFSPCFTLPDSSSLTPPAPPVPPSDGDQSPSDSSSAGSGNDASGDTGTDAGSGNSAGTDTGSGATDVPSNTPSSAGAGAGGGGCALAAGRYVPLKPFFILVSSWALLSLATHVSSRRKNYDR